MWLLGEETVPDHSTISRFKSEKLSEVIDGLFAQFVKKLKALNEIAYENIFIDGTKIESSANKYTFVWKKAVTKNEAKLQAKLKNKLDEIHSAYDLKYSNCDEKIEVQQINEALDKLYAQKQVQEIEFVYGKGKRKTQLQRDIETLKEMRKRQLTYDDHKEQFGDRNSYSKTDPDATFMRMKMITCEMVSSSQHTTFKLVLKVNTS